MAPWIFAWAALGAVLFLLLLSRRRRGRRRRLRDLPVVEATVVSSETREEFIAPDTLGPASTWLTLTFLWQGVEKTRTYGPIGGQVPKAGQRVPLRYDPGTGELLPGPGGNGRLALSIVLPFLLVFALIALGVAWDGAFREATGISEPVYLLLGLVFLGLGLWSFLERLQFLSRVREGKLRPIPATLRAYRRGTDSDGDTVYYPVYEYLDQGELRRMDGSSLGSRKLRPGSRVTLYRDAAGQIREEPSRAFWGPLVFLGGLGLIFLLAAFLL